MNQDLDDARALITPVIVLIVAFMFLVAALVMTSSCTLNVIMTHTEGSATDVVDSNPSTKADVSPDISVPLIP
jgi:hypothetical protein